MNHNPNASGSAEDYYNARLTHPLIESLTPLPIDFKAMAKQLQYLPPLPDAAVRAREPNQRLRLTSVLRELHIPSDRDVGLAYQIDELIRTGYEARPISAEHYATAKDRIDGLVEAAAATASPASIQVQCGALIARSGEGKSRACRRAVGRYKPVICHDTKANPLLPAKQVVALILECPSDRTIPSLAVEFVSKLQKSTKEKIPARFTQGNRSTIISNIAELCETYWIGLLVLDECQHGLKRGVPDLQFMNFLVEMSNKLSVPILYVGTPAALKLIGGELRQARRMLGMKWDGFGKDNPHWEKFVHTMWPYQFTKIFTPLRPELMDALSDFTQAIPAFAITLYEFAQRYAIAACTDEVICVDHFKAVYEDMFTPVHPMLEALKSGEPDRIAQFEDLAYHNEIDAWFKGLEKLREELRMKAVSKIANAQKRAIKAMVAATRAEANVFARSTLIQSDRAESLIQVLMAAKQLGLDPANVLKDAIAKLPNKGAA